MTVEDYMATAIMLRKYANAVESKLYVNMKIPEAFKEIAEAERLAALFEETANEKLK